jgi:hypothetical protein
MKYFLRYEYLKIIELQLKDSFKHTYYMIRYFFCTLLITFSFNGFRKRKDQKC